MTDIEAYEATSSEVAGREPVIEGPLALWASEARQAYSIAVSLAKTSFVPNQFRDKPHEITAAILAGKELDLEPMSALRSIAIINGTPALTALAMRGLVQSHGHDIEVISESPTRAVVKGTRRNGLSTTEHVSEWTLDRAKGLNLLSRDNWQKQPQAMLVARATSEACRRTASDVLLGMPYSVEELADVDGNPEDLKPKKRRRAALPAKPQRGDLEPELTPESVDNDYLTAVDIEPELESTNE
jgi:hypothetical protein